ncbi:MAG: hypothetical protein WCJ51_02180 [Candidatus Moraniibacteriota bacterium]
MEQEPEKKEVEVVEEIEVKKEETVVPAKEGKKWQCKLTKLFKNCKLMQGCKLAECCKNGKGKWKMMVAGLILLLIVAGGFLFARQYKKNNIGVAGARAKVEQFIKENTPQNGAGIVVKEVVKENGLYKVTIDANKQEIVAYVTGDGSKFFPNAIELNAKKEEAAKEQQATPEKAEAEQKAEVPTVDLFVMSYCPYGLQMERGVLPAVAALGSKIKFNLKFVSYTLHGQKEVDENVNQYCIEKTQPAKLASYLQCFWKDSKGTSATCVKTTGVNPAQLATCVADTNKQFSPTEKAFDLNKEETVKFGVQGSPTLVVNGTTLASGRDSVSVLKAICSGFATQPKECQAKLSATAPVAGFDDQAAASAGGSAPAASCATPQ